MRRLSLVFLLLASGCAGRAASPGVTPETAAPEPTAPPAAATPAPPPPTQQADFDRQLEAESEADMAVLEALASAAPEPDVRHGATGGPNAIEAAVTWDIDVETFGDHDRVQFYLDFFQGAARERMAIWLTRLPRYEPMIRAELARRDVPSDMIYLALIESGFSNTAISRARAVGMWQFMKGTAGMYGLRVDRWVDERRDPVKATVAAAHHLADLRDRFGSIYLAAAAYNAGAGRVSRGLRGLPGDDESGTDATFFRLYDTRYLRRETKDYVPKLIAAALIAKEPQKYGFDPVPEVVPFAYDSVLVTDAVGLDVVARLADTSLAAIRELNPQFLRLATPPGARSTVRVPPGSGAITASRLAVLPARERVTFREHFVQRGETLGHIARRYGMSVGELEDANPRVKPRALQVGQRIIIPTGAGSLTPEARRAIAAADAPARSRGASYHVVRRGDTLGEIARRYRVSTRQLQVWNGLRGDLIRAGQRLRVRAPA